MTKWRNSVRRTSQQRVVLNRAFAWSASTDDSYGLEIKQPLAAIGRIAVIGAVITVINCHVAVMEHWLRQPTLGVT